jgi:uncharacterized protein (DUF2062 family)
MMTPMGKVSRLERVRYALRDTWRRLRGGELSARRAAASVAVGLFVGFVPLYGIQTFICLAFTVPLRLDFPLAWATSNIANPFTAPFIILLDIELGGWLADGAWVTLSTHDFEIKKLGPFLARALLGGAVVGAAVALLGGIATLLWMQRRLQLARNRSSDQSITRTPST